MKKIKIYERKLVTIDENGIKETWEPGYGETKFFLRFKGKVWDLVKSNDKNYKDSSED